MAAIEKPAALITCQSDGGTGKRTIACPCLCFTLRGLPLPTVICYSLFFSSPDVVTHCTGKNASCPDMCKQIVSTSGGLCLYTYYRQPSGTLVGSWCHPTPPGPSTHF